MPSLLVQNAYLTDMLRQAGLNAEAKEVEQRIQSVLTDEIHHRMKNMLTMVTAIVRQSMRSATNLVEAESAISARLIAMGRAHDLLLKTDLKSAGLRGIIAAAVAQHNSTSGSIHVTGEEIEVTPAAILPLTLILNELCTNAIKHGALSVPDGRVTLRWGLDATQAALVLRWVEKNGPLVRPPANRSFGSRLLEEAIPRQLGGFGELSFPLTGAAFCLTVPLHKLRPVESDESHPDQIELDKVGMQTA